MNIQQRLVEYLDEKRVSYGIIRHPEAYTAQETAEAEHASGKDVAKVVILWVDGRFVMAVLPASHRVSFHKVKALLGAHEVRLAGEEEFKRFFEGCETGAMPPFGDFFDLPFFVDIALADRKYIVFNAGTHRVSLRMSYADYVKIAEPEIVEFSEEPVGAY